MAKYSDARNVQLVIALLKKYGIRNVIASPGTTNVPFVYSVQNDSFFRVRSAFDERSAAYMACGLAGESGEPVVLSCTGATASRDYMPGLTEAFIANFLFLPLPLCISLRTSAICLRKFLIVRLFRMILLVIILLLR